MPHLSLSRCLKAWLAVGCIAAGALVVAHAEDAGVELPFELNFEAEAGYQPGPLFFDPWWQFPESLFVQVNDFGSVGEQSLGFLGQGLLSLRPTGSRASAVTWIDFLSKPVYFEVGDLPRSVARERSTLTGFVKVDGEGEVYAVDGDGFGSGDWVASGSRTTLDGDTSAQWLRFTYRLDYSKKTWDLFVDGKLLLADLGFIDNAIERFTEFSVGSAEDSPTSIDYFYAGGLNPMYEDFSNDGIPDVWLISQGLNIYVNQRYGDHDNDGLSNLLEYMLGTRADNADSDGDGLSDGVEYLLGYNPRVTESHVLSSLPFHDDFESYGPNVPLTQNGWSIVGDEVAVQRDDVFAGNAALSVAEGIVWNRFRGAGNQVVWMDVQMKPTFLRETPEVIEHIGVVYHFDASGRIVAFDGDGDGSGHWVALDGPAVNGWRRVTVRADYQAQSYDIYVNGERLSAGFGFAYRQPFMSKLEARGLTLLDDVSISAVEPTGLDDDRDGIDNATERSLGTNPNAFDTDGDGLSDALEILWGLDPLVADTYLAVPTETTPGVFGWSTSFSVAEGYTAGALGGQDGWSATGVTDVSSEEDAVLTQLAEADSSFKRLFGVGENRRIWITFNAKLLVGPMPAAAALTQPAVALMGFTDNKTLVVWDDASREWRNHPVVADPTEWNSYAIYLDYVGQTWSICQNGVMIARDLPFKDKNLAVFSRFKALQANLEEDTSPEGDTQQARFDDFAISTIEPGGLDFDGDGLSNELERALGTDPYKVDTDGDGMPDDWEYAHGLNPLRNDANADADGDGMANIDEYRFGLNPNVADVEGIVGFANRDIWRGIGGNSVAGLTNNSKFPSNPSVRTLINELDSGFNELGESSYGQRIRGLIIAPVTGMYTFWIAADDRAELWLSANEEPYERELIASVKDGTTTHRQWQKYGSQRSEPVHLVAGKEYYFEILHKESGAADHVAVAWQYPGQAQQVVPGAVLRTVTSDPNDLDDDGLPDDWEIQNGLDPSRGYGENGFHGDRDGDGVANYLERRYGTSPTLADTDGDGYSDYVELFELNSDPTVPNPVEWIVADEINPVETTEIISGNWVNGSSMLIGRGQGGGTLSVPLSVATDGIYQVSLSLTRMLDNASSQNQPVVFLWYLDGDYIGMTKTFSEANKLKYEISKQTPYILSGQHELKVRWQNVYRDSVIGLDGIKVLKAKAGSAEVLSQWIVDEISKTDSIRSDSLTSQVSPYCLEGTGRFISLMSILPTSEVRRSGRNQWYADVPLNEHGATPVEVSFQNGGYGELLEVEWVPTNLFSSGSLEIRVGDSLKLFAAPEGDESGTFRLSVNGQTLGTDLTSPLPYRFDVPGVYTIVGTHVNATGAVSARSVQVSVIGVNQPNEIPVLWAERLRTWSWENLSNAVEVEGNGLLLSEESTNASGKRTYTLRRDDPYDDIAIVARLRPGGPILACAMTEAFWLRATVEGVLTSYPCDESTDQVYNDIFVDGLPDHVDVKVSVFKAGVVLDDGTRTRSVKARDFNRVGVYTFSMYKPDSVSGGACHRIEVYQKGKKIGER